MIGARTIGGGRGTGAAGGGRGDTDDGLYGGGDDDVDDDDDEDLPWPLTRDGPAPSPVGMRKVIRVGRGTLFRAVVRTLSPVRVASPEVGGGETDREGIG